VASRSARGHPRLGGEITFGHRWCAAQAPQRNAALAVASWYVAETYLKVRGKWVNLYRPIDRHGNLIDAMLSEYRDMAAVKASCRVGGPVFEQDHPRLSPSLPVSSRCALESTVVIAQSAAN
jgi:hypothetical protein